MDRKAVIEGTIKRQRNKVENKERCGRWGKKEKRNQEGKEKESS